MIIEEIYKDHHYYYDKRYLQFMTLPGFVGEGG